MNERLHRLLLPCLLGAALAACQTAPVQEAPRAEIPALAPVQPPPIDLVAERAKALAQALATYSDGDYDAAIAQLGPLATAPELSLGDRVRVYKTLAFSQCALMQLKDCRQSFDDALAQDPTFQLTEAERGHPVWGREFRAARAATRNRASTP